MKTTRRPRFRALPYMCAALLLALLPARLGAAATLRWDALPDRERVTITLHPAEGVAGTVGRIDPKAVLVPFTEVPEGVYLPEAPAGAKIFNGTKIRGRALVFLTKTPEFGFMVNKHSSTELVVDFYPNQMGARWRPSEKAPTTELPPDTGVPDYAPPDEANKELAADPSGTESGSQINAALTELATQAQPQAQAAAPQPQAQPQAQAVAAQPQAQPQAQAAAPQPQAVAAQQQPQAAQAPSQTASPKAQAAQPPAAQGQVVQGRREQSPQTPPSPPQAPAASASPAAAQTGGAPAGTLPPAVQAAAQTRAVPATYIDGRRQTEERSAPLPLPEPPMTFSGQARPDAAPQDGDPPLPVAARTAVAPVPTPLGAISVPEQSPAAGRQGGSTPYVGQPQPVEQLKQAAPAQTAAQQAAAPQQQNPRPAAQATPVQATAQQAAARPQQAQQPAPRQTQAVVQQPSAPQEGTPQSAQPPAAQTPRQPQPPAEQRQNAAQPAEQPAGQQPPPGVAVSRDGGKTYSGMISVNVMSADNPPQAAPQSGGAPAGDAAAPALPPSVEKANAANPEAGKNATAKEGKGHSEASKHDAPGNAHGGADSKAPPPPPEPEDLLPEIRRDISAGNYRAALEKTDLLLTLPKITNDQREEGLHIRAEMLFALNKDHLAEHYQEITDASNKALNYNTSSNRNAGTLLRLGYVNLRLKHIPEAEALFNMMRRRYPKDDNIPLTYYYWGDYHFSRNELQRAADEFQHILQEYSNSRYAREAALGLARSYYRLGYYKQAFDVVDYIERRWSRFYIEYPPFLNMMGDVAFRLGKLQYALEHYWLYVNLEPKGDEADIILTRIGDIYAQQRERGAAKRLYEESVHRFPDKDGGLVAMMRLAEEGINDDPSIASMFGVFDGPFTMRPAEVYRTIIEKHPDSSLVPLAELKLAMWHLWNKDFIQTLDACSAFIDKFPKHELAPKAREIAMQTFAVLVSEGVGSARYGRINEIWEKYPIVRSQEGQLSSESRVALGVSLWKQGKPDEALRAVEPFFLGNKVPEYSEMALSLVLNIYLGYDQWDSIREVAKRVDLWELTPKSRLQLDYALALAGENLGDSDAVASLWSKVYEAGAKGELSLGQQSYAAYFLARDAERKRELEKAYLLGKEAFSLLSQQAEKSSGSGDMGKIISQLGSLMELTEVTGRLKEALGYAENYLQHLPENDPERLSVLYRMARIYKKQGSEDGWKKTLTELAQKYPNTVYGQTASSELRSAAISDDAARYTPGGQM